MSAMVMVYGLVTAKALPQGIGFFVCIAFLVLTTFRVKAEEVKKRKATEAQRDQEREEYLRSVSAIESKAATDIEEWKRRLLDAESKIGCPALSLSFQIRQKKSWVDSGSGSLPSEW